MLQSQWLMFMLVLIAPTLAYKNYTGYQVLTSNDVTPEAIAALHKMQLDPRFDFWTIPHTGRPLRVMTSSGNVAALHEALSDLQLQPSVLISDLNEVIMRDRVEWEEIKKRERRSNRAVTFDRYMELAEILEYLDELVAAYPDLVSLEDIGTSYEGRPLRAIKISNGPGKQQIFLDAGIHPREYLGPPLALKMIYELVENYEVNKPLVDVTDWFILPIANPDGYVFTFEEDRYWRKTRKPNQGSDCVGTDPNRNFDFHWGEDGDIDYCSQSYHGDFPNSESETAALATVLKERGDAGLISLYMATHTFGAFLLYPYGYTLAYPSNADDLQAAGDTCASAIEAVNGTHYVVGSCANVYFQAFGNAMDYAHGVCNIPLVYTWELVEGGMSGFDPPNSDIASHVGELWEGIKAIAYYVTNK